eukprot:6018602-Amphidinium_carterae.1
MSNGSVSGLSLPVPSLVCCTSSPIPCLPTLFASGSSPPPLFCFGDVSASWVGYEPWVGCGPCRGGMDKGSFDHLLRQTATELHHALTQVDADVDNAGLTGIGASASDCRMEAPLQDNTGTGACAPQVAAAGSDSAELPGTSETAKVMHAGLGSLLEDLRPVCTTGNIQRPHAGADRLYRRTWGHKDHLSDKALHALEQKLIEQNARAMREEFHVAALCYEGQVQCSSSLLGWT